MTFMNSYIVTLCPRIRRLNSCSFDCIEFLNNQKTQRNKIEVRISGRIRYIISLLLWGFCSTLQAATVVLIELTSIAVTRVNIILTKS